MTPEEFTNAITKWATQSSGDIDFASMMFGGYEGWIQVALALQTAKSAAIFREFPYYNNVDVSRAKRYVADFALPQDGSRITLWEMKAIPQVMAERAGEMKAKLISDFTKFNLTQTKIAGVVDVRTGMEPKWTAVGKYMIIFYPRRGRDNLAGVIKELDSAYMLRSQTQASVNVSEQVGLLITKSIDVVNLT